MDIRDKGDHYACCCICGIGLKGSRQWWCANCGRTNELDTYANAPEWIRFLVRSERKRRYEYIKDSERLISLDALAEGEDFEEEGQEDSNGQD